ncbi:MAG: 4-hydroxy-tetrahydrodipicolinate reductase [Acidimicrobiia bacterium]|nr:MAG: 4-hydroxy-tetrahydrodipicolinate reductase [Acidimicrobiia bacterium]
MKVGVSGASGRMGGLAATTIDESDDLHLIALYDRHTAGKIAGLPISQDPSALEGCDVVVEFSRPDAVMDHISTWRSFGANVVVGTSGFDAERMAMLEKEWGTGPANCLVVPNFSIGAVLMMKMAEMAARHMPVAEIVEMHHDSKADAPSGTAIATAQIIAAASSPQTRAVESEELHSGALGANVAGVRVHSVRLPGVVAHQDVIFGGEGETLRISHDTTDRTSFMPGLLLAIRSIPSQKETLAVGLDRLLRI